MTDTLDHPSTSQPHRIERVRHELKWRLLTVKRRIEVTPGMIRITLTGADLAGFTSGAHDDHVKLLFPKDGEEAPRLPTVDAQGRAVGDRSAKPVMRDYTPRRYDSAANELDIDFAIHEAGPATRWALQARPGQRIGLGGPRGSLVVADDFDWYLLVGDETALPAIGRRLAELRPDARAIVIAEVASASDEQIFLSRATVTSTWLHRGAVAPGGTTLMDEALRALRLPDGDGYAWLACESETAKRLRRILVDERQHPKSWLKAAGYWKRGAADFHETHEG